MVYPIIYIHTFSFFFLFFVCRQPSLEYNRNILRPDPKHHSTGPKVLVFYCSLINTQVFLQSSLSAVSENKDFFSQSLTHIGLFLKWSKVYLLPIESSIRCPEYLYRANSDPGHAEGQMWGAEVDLGGKHFFSSKNQLNDRRESAGKLEHLPVNGWGGAWIKDFNWKTEKEWLFMAA